MGLSSGRLCAILHICITSVLRRYYVGAYAPTLGLETVRPRWSALYNFDRDELILKTALKFVAAILAVAVFGALLFLWELYRVFNPAHSDYSWRQKTTLVVETPEGTVTGASVVRIYAILYKGANIGGLEVSYGVIGEAVALELLPGRWLFATIGEPAEGYYWADRSRFEGQQRKVWMPRIRKQEGVVSLMKGRVPELVTFDDIEDPKTARAVDPQDLAVTFGPGFALRDITLEIVDEPVTDGELGPLGEWIGGYRNKQLDGSWPQSARGELPNSTSLNSHDFKRWPRNR